MSQDRAASSAATPLTNVALPEDWCGCTHHAHDHKGSAGPCFRCRCDGFRSTSAGYRIIDGFWVKNCEDCFGTGLYELPDGRRQPCVPCKGTGRAIIALARQGAVA